MPEIIRPIDNAIATTRALRDRDAIDVAIRSIKSGVPVDSKANVPVVRATIPTGPVNAIDIITEGQRLLTVQRGSERTGPARLVTYEVQTVGSKIGLIADDGRELDEYAKKIRKGVVDSGTIYAVESEALLLKGSEQHIETSLDGTSVYVLPIKTRDLGVGQLYRLKVGTGEGVVEEEKAARLIQVNFGPDGDIVFRGFAGRRGSPYKMLVNPDNLTADPNVFGVAVYPNPILFRDGILQAARDRRVNGRA